MFFLDERLNDYPDGVDKKNQPSEEVASKISDLQATVDKQRTRLRVREQEYRSLQIKYQAVNLAFRNEYYLLVDQMVSMMRSFSEKNESLKKKIESEERGFKDLICSLVGQLQYLRKEWSGLVHNCAVAAGDTDMILGELKQINRERIRQGKRPIRLKSERELHEPILGIATPKHYSEIPREALRIYQARQAQHRQYPIAR